MAPRIGNPRLTAAAHSLSLARSRACVAAAGLMLVACSAPGQPQHPTLAIGLSPSACVAALATGTEPDAARCPAFLRRPIAEARAACTEAGGKLEGADDAEVWKLDVDDDGRSEVALELNGNVTCVDAYSLFECGSLGCPKTLYAERDGAWTDIGSLFAYGADGVEITATRRGGHRTLRLCREGPPCVELWRYEWLGEAYDVTRLDVRGVGVDLTHAPAGLRALAAETDVRAAPDLASESLGRYTPGTDVVVIGSAPNGFLYVAPCNACARGFLPPTAVVAR
jgi:hypothetical protein